MHEVQTLDDEQVEQFVGHYTQFPEDNILFEGQEVQTVRSEASQDKQPYLHFKQTVLFMANFDSHSKQISKF